MRNGIPFIILLLSFLHTSAQKDTCNVGIYINSIYDFKLDEKSYMADFWVWLNYKDSTLRFEDVLELTNSKEANFSHFSTETRPQGTWTVQKCKAEMIHLWDVSKFPFDVQRLQIEIEDSQYDTSILVYLADKRNSKLNSTFNKKEWRVEAFSIQEGIKTYETNYGDPLLSGHSSYPRIVATVVIRRNNSWLMLFKMLTGAYVAFFISCLVFFISSENQDSRFGLCVGGLFAAIGNKYIVESIVPTSTTYTLMDNVHNLTFTFILLIVIASIISLHFYESGVGSKRRLSMIIDKTALWSIVALYVLLNIILVLFAIH